ncbi:hypothetical protein Mp_4g01330 [Marchantia polymorpha subsp. ruderalis]|uniref:Uncharacterized protein n=2 Tax=Marchantia polymorpha TaxID=3197 RepID=A0AAF6B553_MARPO|nr:hypothetical protein MARPO_0066s0010 [Marchantia polymorpha]PTQ36048.1 hypothetical protein MARPO_0066s0010 [Marchantia polymorpha]BBN07136.1 hypothetical protein Mp_4g01330 [Marchantia polymorpha subsp. ruderalis]BBN07137.1 hypothetical protein Mp_4g01330 [Marchantia polymorpha subsp. ruderalis]|eukprot:PTQ36047.1 hypothetical protein MARPO_0066s0010 [Marchantia polymorpha]
MRSPESREESASANSPRVQARQVEWSDADSPSKRLRENEWNYRGIYVSTVAKIPGPGLSPLRFVNSHHESTQSRDGARKS